MRQRLYLHFILLLILFGVPISARAELRLSGIFSDHMVIQREQPVLIWGWADQGHEIIVKYDGQTVATTTDDQGVWHVKLAPMKHNSTGRKLSVHRDTESLVLRDVVVGDVWHASGQSNMAMQAGLVAKKIADARQHIINAHFPGIRFRRISENASAKQRDNVPTGRGWIACSPKTAVNFSAAAFYFARKLHKELEVPIGVIDTSRGGTPIEPFIPRAAFASHPTLQQELKLGDQGDLSGIWKLPGGVRARDANWLPGRLFHSRLAPITQFSVRGAIWYQGESNCGKGEDPRDYQYKMRALINGWRKAMGDDTMPFYFVQLPGSGAGTGWPYLREQQRLSSDLPYTEMVVTIDLLDKDIHPPNKIDVGERLARCALAREYKKTLSYSGPMFQQAIVNKGKIRVQFSHADSGLMIAVKTGVQAPRENRIKKLSHFELADSSGRWFPAQAVIQDKDVVVTSEEVANPVAVRYACAVDPQNCHLYNRDGLPASPFCSHSEFFRYAPQFPVD